MYAGLAVVHIVDLRSMNISFHMCDWKDLNPSAQTDQSRTIRIAFLIWNDSNTSEKEDSWTVSAACLAQMFVMQMIDAIDPAAGEA